MSKNMVTKFILTWCLAFFSHTALPMAITAWTVAKGLQGASASALFIGPIYWHALRPVLAQIKKEKKSEAIAAHDLINHPQTDIDNSTIKTSQHNQLDNRPSPLVRAFIDNALRAGNMVNPSHIEVVMNVPAYDFSVRGNNLLCVPYSNQKIEQLIKDNSPKLNRMRADIAHEAGHILHNDNYNKEQTVLPCLALGVPAAVLLLQQLCYRAPKEPSLMFTAGRVALAVPTTIFVSLANAWYSRWCEWRADENIPDDPVLLEAELNNFLKRAKNKPTLLAAIIEDIKGAWKTKKISTWQACKELAYYTLVLNTDLFNEHPADSKRAKRFQERLALLNEGSQ